MSKNGEILEVDLQFPKGCFMNSFPPRPIIEVLREALQTLDTDPKPLTPKKRELLRQIRYLIAECEATQRPNSSS